MNRRMLLALGLGAIPAAAWAQDFPSRPLRVVVGFPPGGGTDLVARPLAQGIQAPLGQSAVVDNRGGANGGVGLEVVAKSTPDGYTIGHVNSSVVITNPLLYRNFPSTFSAISRRSARSPIRRWWSQCRRIFRPRISASSSHWRRASRASFTSARAGSAVSTI